MICFVLAFAFAFIAVKPISVSAEDEAENAAATSTTATTSPKTGDEGVMIYAVLMLLSLIGMVCISLKKND